MFRPCSPSRFPTLLLLIALTAVALPTARAAVLAGGEAGVWDSAVAPTAVLKPIGGSGQVNGEFILDTVDLGSSAVQVGLRAQERGVGVTWPRAGNVYFVETGFDPSSGGTRATWNYDFHVDFGTSDADTTLTGASLESQLLESLTPLNIRDFTVEIEFDTDPTAATSFNALSINDILDALTYGSEVRLYQESWNPLFALLGGPIDATVEGIYDFRLTVSDPGSGEVVAQTLMKVVAVDTLPVDPFAATVDLSLAQVDSVDPVVVSAGNPGDLVYTVTLSNQGVASANNIEVSEELTLPTGVSLDATPAASVGSVSGSEPSFTWSVPSLAPGASATLTVDLTVDPSADLGTDVVAGAAAITAVDEPDVNLFNQSAAESTSIACPDGDGDGVCDADDNCPADFNPTQADNDGDGVGKVCDLCFGDDATGDSDMDGVCDEIDFCTGDDGTGDPDMDGVCANRDCDESDPLNACHIFTDGFESGDTTLWSNVVP